MVEEGIKFVKPSPPCPASDLLYLGLSEPLPDRSRLKDVRKRDESKKKRRVKKGKKGKKKMTRGKIKKKYI